MVFNQKPMRIANIRDEQPHGSVRARIHGLLGQARLALQVDIGFGDVMTPWPEQQDYPTLLDLPAPRLWTYPRETVVAEKLEALVSRDETNSRVKDLGIDHDRLDNDDKFMRHLAQAVRNGLGERAGTCIDPKTQSRAGPCAS